MDDTVDFLRSVMYELATRAAEGSAYAKHWGDTFVREQIQEVWLDTGKGMRKPRGRTVSVSDLRALSRVELRSLGFRRWDEVTSLYLIPLYAFNYIEDGGVLTSISGCSKTKGNDDIDLDQRYGCIAYGFRYQEKVA